MVQVTRRLKVVVPGGGVGLGLSLGFAFPVLCTQPNPFHPATALLVLCAPSAGPFAEPLAFVDYNVAHMCAWSGVLATLIALHPCWPRRWTAVVSGLALGFWYLIGFGCIYNGA